MRLYDLHTMPNNGILTGKYPNLQQSWTQIVYSVPRCTLSKNLRYASSLNGIQLKKMNLNLGNLLRCVIFSF